MTNGMHSKRARVMIVEEDLDFGIKLADWLAAHGYQAVLVRSVVSAIDECKDLNPQAVFIGLSHPEPEGGDRLPDPCRRFSIDCMFMGEVLNRPSLVRNRLRPRSQRGVKQDATPRQPIFKVLDL